MNFFVYRSNRLPGFGRLAGSKTRLTGATDPLDPYIAQMYLVPMRKEHPEVAGFDWGD